MLYEVSEYVSNKAFKSISDQLFSSMTVDKTTDAYFST